MVKIYAGNFSDPFPIFFSWRVVKRNKELKRLENYDNFSRPILQHSKEIIFATLFYVLDFNQLLLKHSLQ